MRAWHIISANEIELVEQTRARNAGEVKLKLSKVALSSQELAFLATGEQGAHSVPGHSAIGFVSEADDDSGLPLGSRVAISPFVTVAEHGESAVKTMGVDADGLLQDFAIVSQENVFPLPDGISDEQAVFTDYIAMGNRVFESIEANNGDYVVIVGAGTLGLILSQLALYYQLVPVLVDLDAEKLELTKQWGVSYTLDPTYDNLERRTLEITGGRMCDAAIFAGEGVGLNAAIRLVKSEGEVIIAGYSFHEKHKVDTDVILKKQLKLKGVCNGDGEISSAINLLANKIVRTDGLLNAKFSFDELPKIVDECVKYPYKYNNILVESN